MFVRFATALLVFAALLNPVRVYAATPTFYTYNYDIWADATPSPDAYRVSAYLLGENLPCGAFRDPQGLYIRDNRIYVCDSGNNRIVMIMFDEHTRGYEVSEIIEGVTIDGSFSALNYPMDVFETQEGELYIADTNNGRVLRLDRDRNFVLQMTRPVDETFDDSIEFQPFKFVVDVAGRIFLQARNVNKGLIEYDSTGDFIGYMGANKVSVDPIDLLWKRISTRAQRAAMDLFIPTEYSNADIDDEGFIYVTNTNPNIDPVRRLNAMGADILVRNGYYDPVGDVQLGFGVEGSVSGPSRFIDAATFSNDCYACFDRNRGRIFVYDFQGNLLYAFGGLGNREGFFTMPVALDNMGMNLFALDSRTGALTAFELTDYGRMVNEALLEYKNGRYDRSSGLWEEVLKRNGNYDLGYIGIGRAALRQGDYKKAMEYFEIKKHQINYGKAFALYRKEWMEENLWWILIIIVAAIITPAAFRFTRNLVREVRKA